MQEKGYKHETLRSERSFILKMKRRIASIFIVITIIGSVIGCNREQIENAETKATTDNIVITETGEILEKPTQEPIPILSEQEMINENMELKEQEKPTPSPAIELDIPIQKQTITEEDQIEPQGKGLQLVFLGDSIFDNNRDGTGIPYLTAVQCDADVFNLAIGGTCATLEEGESYEIEKWTSRSFCGVANALLGRISTDIFKGTRTKELLDNPDIDFSKTDYFIVQYGINDFFRSVRRDDSESFFNLYTYTGALRYGVSQLKEVAPDATIILCSPCYAQFYHDGYMVGEGNMTNPGNGTLFDYAGTCNYVANEAQVEFFNAYQDLGINGYTADDYLEDGVHLTEAGRKLYADALAHRILVIEETKNN